MVAGAGLLRYCRELSASEPQPAMAAPGRVKWWEKEPEPTTVWRACLTDDGLDYYVNTESNEVYVPPVHTPSLFPARPPPALALLRPHVPNLLLVNAFFHEPPEVARSHPSTAPATPAPAGTLRPAGICSRERRMGHG